MPRDLFGDVSDPSVRVGSQSRYTVPLSLLAHLVVIVTLLLVPLMATNMLPEIRDNVIFVGEPRLPEPPPPVRAAQSERRMPVALDAAPIDVPEAIAPETGLEAGFERDRGAIDGAIPGVVDGDVSSVLTPRLRRQRRAHRSPYPSAGRSPRPQRCARSRRSIRRSPSQRASRAS